MSKIRSILVHVSESLRPETMEFIDPQNINVVSNTLVATLGCLVACSAALTYYLSSCPPMCALAQVVCSTLSSLQAAVVGVIVALHLWRKAVVDGGFGGRDEVELVDHSSVLRWTEHHRHNRTQTLVQAAGEVVQMEAVETEEKTILEAEDSEDATTEAGRRVPPGLGLMDHEGIRFRSVARKDEGDIDIDATDSDEEDDEESEEDGEDTEGDSADQEEEEEEEEEDQEEVPVSSGKDVEVAFDDALHAKGDSRRAGVPAQSHEERKKDKESEEEMPGGFESESETREREDDPEASGTSNKNLEDSFVFPPPPPLPGEVAIKVMDSKIEEDSRPSSHEATLGERQKQQALAPPSRSPSSLSYFERLEAKRSLKHTSAGSYAARKVIKQQKLLRREVERQMSLLARMQAAAAGQQVFPTGALERTKKKIEYLKDQLNRTAQSGGTVDSGDKTSSTKETEEEISIVSTKSYEETTSMKYQKINNPEN